MISGDLAAGEDRDGIAAALRDAPERVLAGELKLFAADADARLEALRLGRLKRFVFALETAGGPRIVKIVQPVTWSRRLAGLAGGSQPRTEHRLHSRAAELGVAETESRGWLELRRGPLLVRACQVQTPIAAGRRDLDAHVAAELARHGPAAVEPLADALAEMHALPFFHADVKGYHAFPALLDGGAGPARYRLRWIDLGRVSFWMSPRKRIINLYQVLRFILPRDPELQRRFVERYCATAEWRSADRVLTTVRAFLEHKLRTHPV